VTLDLDLASFYGDEFTVTATLTHGTVVTHPKVIYDRAGAVNVMGEIEVRNAAPSARCKTEDVSTAVKGDTLVIDSVTYYIIDIEPINTDETVLHLSLSS